LQNAVLHQLILMFKKSIPFNSFKPQFGG
jgi:hypothetical protein